LALVTEIGPPPGVQAARAAADREPDACYRDDHHAGDGNDDQSDDYSDG